MVDISTLMSAISLATSSAKSLLKIKEIADSAEAKMAIAELTDKLADTKMSFADLKEELLKKDEKIRELEKKLSHKSTLARHNELYFETDNAGKPTGDPYCPKCFESEQKSIHLTTHSPYDVICPVCETIFDREPGSSNLNSSPNTGGGNWMD